MRIISDNGPQFMAFDFKLLVRELRLAYVRNWPYLSQTERRGGALLPDAEGRVPPAQTPLTLEDARRVVARFMTFHNEVRLHSAIGYLTPKDMLEGRAEKVHAERDRKFEELESDAAGPSSRRFPHELSSPSGEPLGVGPR